VREKSPALKQRKNLAQLVYLIVLNLLVTADLGLDVPLIVRITELYQISEFHFSLFLIVPFTLFSGIFSFVWGYFSDQYSRKVILELNLFLGGLFILAVGLGFLFELAFFFPAFFRVMSAVALAGVVPVSMNMVVDLIQEEERGGIFGWLGISGLVGYGLGFLLSGALVRYGIFVPYLVGSGLAFFFLLLGRGMPEPKRAQGEKILYELISQGKLEYGYKIELSALRTIFSHPINIFLFLFVIIFSMPAAALGIFFIPFLVRNHNFNEFWATLYLLAVFSSQVFGQVVFGRLGDRWYARNERGRVWAMLVALVCAVPFLVLAFLVPFDLSHRLSLLIFSALMLLGGFFMVGPNPLTLTIFCDINLPEHRGTVLALNYIGWLIARILSAPLCSFLAGRWEMNYAPAFLLISLFLIPASFFLLPVLWQVSSALKEKSQLLKSRLQSWS